MQTPSHYGACPVLALKERLTWALCPQGPRGDGSKLVTFHVPYISH